MVAHILLVSVMVSENNAASCLNALEGRDLLGGNSQHALPPWDFQHQHVPFLLVLFSEAELGYNHHIYPAVAPEFVEVIK